MSAERPAAVFLNEGAGSASSWRVRRAVELTRAALGADLHVTATRDLATFIAWMKPRVAGYATVVVAGGDGTLSGACNLLAGQDVTIGFIPAGFGNAAAHVLRLPRDPVTLAAVLAAGAARPVNLIRVEADEIDRLAMFAGIGWDAVVAQRYGAAGLRGLPGWAAAIVRSLPNLLHRPEIVVEVDGAVVHRGPAQMVVIGTTPYYGRGLLANPGADPSATELTGHIYSGRLPSFAWDAFGWVLRRTTRSAAIHGHRVMIHTPDGRELALEADGDALGLRSAWICSWVEAPVRLVGRW